MAFLNEQEKLTLAEQIVEVEMQTDGEIVTVIAAASDGYRYIPILWAALLALAVPGLYLLWMVLSTDGWVAPGASTNTLPASLYLAQVAVFFALGSVFQSDRLRLTLIPGSVKRQRAGRHAREQFYQQNLHETRQRTGLLIFVSVAEHYVEILADKGISERVPDEQWAAIVDNFTDQLKRGQIATGFSQTVERCGTILAREFPASGRNPDELPNPLVEIE